MANQATGETGYEHFLFFLLQIQLYLCCTILFEISNGKTTLFSFLLSFQSVRMLSI